MTGDAYREAIKALGLSVNAAGRFFGVGHSTAHRWTVDGTPVPVELLIRLMLALDVTPNWVNRQIGRACDWEK